MSTRTQRIVFWCLFAGIVAMGALLAFHRQHFRNHVVSLAEDAPLDAPTASTEPITLLLASDADGTVIATNRQIALPQEATARVRSLLDHLNSEYALPGSAHPLPPGAMVDDVFLLPLPIVGHAAGTTTSNPNDNPPSTPVASTDPAALQPLEPGGELAVVNLRSSFVNQHPAGVEVESLTLLSIIGTLHANVPQIEQVRFLVDGQPRETLAGHADLLRTYPSRDTSVAAGSASTK